MLGRNYDDNSAMEDALQWHYAENVDHPYHHSLRWRLSACAFFLTCVASFIAFNYFQPEWISVFWATFMTLGLASALTCTMYFWLNGMFYPNKFTYQRTGEDIEKQIAKAKARGDFERFGEDACK